VRRNRGSILMFSLWVLIILVVFAVSLGRQAFLDLKLAEYQRDKLKASVWASCGVTKAIAMLKKDGVDAKTKDYDIIQECGVDLSGRRPEEAFSYNAIDASGGFTIGREDADGEFRYGLRDEESKININGTSDFDKKKVAVLLRESRVADAEGLAEAVIRWITPGNENEAAKKERYRAPEELQEALEYFYRSQGYPEALSRSRMREAYGRMNGSFTMYGDARININTVPDALLRIFILAIAENAGQSFGDVEKYGRAGESVCRKLLSLRQSSPLKNEAEIFLDNLTGEEETNIFTALKPYLKVRSDVFLIPAAGKARSMQQYISAVYDRKGEQIVYWNEN
jgi:type II secretory pathway component PulK